MIAQHKIIILRGELLPRGVALLGPAGISAKSEFLSWSSIARIGAEEKTIETHKAAGLGGAALFGYGASFLLGPAGVAAAAVAGGVLAGARLLESFEVWDAGGRFAEIRARSGVMRQARQWKELAKHVLAADARPLIASKPSGFLPFRKKPE